MCEYEVDCSDGGRWLVARNLFRWQWTKGDLELRDRAGCARGAGGGATWVESGREAQRLHGNIVLNKAKSGVSKL